MNSNEKKKKRSSFSGSIGFVMAAAGSAVGLGNIWRFPYLAAKNGGGTFLFVYIVLVFTFGFTLLTTEVALGRKTKQGPLTAYGALDKRFSWNGFFAWLVPIIILPYYCAIGGWVLKYCSVFITGQGVSSAADGYFTGHITSFWSPLIWMLVFLGMTSFIVFSGVEKGIEKYSKILMPTLIVLVIGISCFALTLHHVDEAGVSRTGLQGLKIYLIPDFSGMTLKSFMMLVLDALGQLFYSISVAMGIMVAYGSYVPDDADLMKSINQIEFFDTLVAVIAGMMIIPAVYTFMGTEGMTAGPGLMFISLPKVFAAMGPVGNIVGILLFVMVVFAAVTSSVSIMEAIVAGVMDKWKLSRRNSAILASLYALVAGSIVCFGYNIFYFEYKLPNGSVAQILDIMDYVSNSVLMPIVAIVSCILVGWVAKPKTIIDEVKKSGSGFGREKMYIGMVKFVAPVLLVILFVQSFMG